MNVCFLTASLSRDAGGLYQSVRGLAVICRNLGRNVFVIGVRDRHTVADIAAWQPVVVVACPVFGPQRFNYAPLLNKRLKEGAADILQLHGLWNYTAIVTARWHRQSRKPYIVHPHGMLDSWAVRNSRWKKSLANFFYQKSVLQGADCIRALCQAEAESIRKRGFRNPICILPNGVEAAEPSPQGTGVWEVEDRGGRVESGGGQALKEVRHAGGKVLLNLGRIHPKKGLVNLLKAWAQVQRSEVRGQRSEWVLAIAGWDEGGHEAKLKQLATELGIPWTDVRNQKSEVSRQRSEVRNPTSDFCPPPSVLFLGPQFNEAKAACYRDCDAFILPSFSEGLPVVSLEAWAYGKPVVMTPECNLPEGFSENAAIRITTQTEEIAQGLTRLFGMSAAELDGIGKNGHRIVSSKFDWEKIGEQLNAVCDWVVHGAARPDCVYVD